ncbi:hypothetical protein D3C73_1189600 [compost metagenome]
MREKLSMIGIEPPSIVKRARVPYTLPKASAAVWRIGFDGSMLKARAFSICFTFTFAPAWILAFKCASTASRICCGSWSPTRRQVILAWASFGMTVLLPSPWKPP